MIHFGAELNVHAGRREQTADVLCANYSTTISAKSQAKCVSVAMTRDKGNLMGIPLAGVKYIYVCADSSQNNSGSTPSKLHYPPLLNYTYETVSRSSDEITSK
jgi:hypothetical protein